jgi:hypothetical protein
LDINVKKYKGRHSMVFAGCSPAAVGWRMTSHPEIPKKGKIFCWQPPAFSIYFPSLTESLLTVFVAAGKPQRLEQFILFHKTRPQKSNTRSSA